MAVEPLLSDLERTVMFALLGTDGDCYGARLQRRIVEITGRDLSPGSLYTTLARMEAKGFVRSWVGEPTAARGGRRKRHFRVEPKGERALERSVAELRALSADLEPRFRLS